MDITLLILYFLVALFFLFLGFARWLVTGNVFQVFTAKFWKSMTWKKFWLALLAATGAGLVEEAIRLGGKFFIK